MKTIEMNPHHTEIECLTGAVAVNTADGIQLQVSNDFDEAYVNLRREEAQELVRLLTEALQ